MFYYGRTIYYVHMGQSENIKWLIALKASHKMPPYLQNEG